MAPDLELDLMGLAVALDPGGYYIKVNPSVSELLNFTP